MIVIVILVAVIVVVRRTRNGNKHESNSRNDNNMMCIFCIIHTYTYRIIYIYTYTYESLNMYKCMHINTHTNCVLTYSCIYSFVRSLSHSFIHLVVNVLIRLSFCWQGCQFREFLLVCVIRSMGSLLGLPGLGTKRMLIQSVVQEASQPFIMPERPAARHLKGEPTPGF